MKVALVHDYLNQYGGGERVFEALRDIFRHADIYTLLYDKERTYGRFGTASVSTSILDVGIVRRHHRPFIPLMPMAIGRINLRDAYDLIISDTAGYAKGVRYNNSFHISYCHTPLRYAWEADTYFENVIFKKMCSPAFSYLKKWDYRAAQKPDVMLANSYYIRKKIKRYYNRDANVVYPPFREDTFFYEPGLPKEDYYLAVGRLLKYKKIELILRAFKGTEKKIKIVGRGPDLNRLKRLATELEVRADFLEFIKSDEELRKIYTQANALLFPQVEDFGLVAVEAMACGTPVIAFKEGGACESIKDGISGLFFSAQSPESLKEAIYTFEKLKFNRNKVSREARRFSANQFREGILVHIPKELRLKLI